MQCDVVLEGTNSNTGDDMKKVMRSILVILALSATGVSAWADTIGVSSGNLGPGMGPFGPPMESVQSIILQPGSMMTIQPLTWTNVSCAGQAIAVPPALSRVSCSCSFRTMDNLYGYVGSLLLVRVLSDGSISQSEIGVTSNFSRTSDAADACQLLLAKTKICAS